MAQHVCELIRVDGPFRSLGRVDYSAHPVFTAFLLPYSRLVPLIAVQLRRLRQ